MTPHRREITGAQRAYCDTYVRWMRGNDSDRELIADELRHLFDFMLFDLDCRGWPVGMSPRTGPKIGNRAFAGRPGTGKGRSLGK